MATKVKTYRKTERETKRLMVKINRAAVSSSKISKLGKMRLKLSRVEIMYEYLLIRTRSHSMKIESHSIVRRNLSMKIRRHSVVLRNLLIE